MEFTSKAKYNKSCRHCWIALQREFCYWSGVLEATVDGGRPLRGFRGSGKVENSALVLETRVNTTVSLLVPSHRPDRYVTPQIPLSSFLFFFLYFSNYRHSLSSSVLTLFSILIPREEIIFSISRF